MILYYHYHRKGNKIMLHVLKEDRGIGVVEMILILVVLIGLVVIFKSELVKLVGNIFATIHSESSGI